MLPENVFFGRECVHGNREAFRLGNKALIVTGANSARKSGALGDVTDVLALLGIGHHIYDRIGENPLVSVCYEGGRVAREQGCDFVIGIGGGSPLDACKAIAAYATHPELAPNDIFTGVTKPLLPIIAVPTTAGTGSEVNPYAVLTIDELNVKRTFKDKTSYPKFAFVDGRYLASMSLEGIISCGLDALCHCIESYLSPKSNARSEQAALEGAAILYPTLRARMGMVPGPHVQIAPAKQPPAIHPGEVISTAPVVELNGSDLVRGYSNLSPNDIQKNPLVIPDFARLHDMLMKGATLGGVAIDVTGTGFPHPLGYNLTLNEGIPHGRATAAFTAEFLTLNEQTAPERCKALYGAMQVDGEAFKRWITQTAGVNSASEPGKWERYRDNVSTASNFANSYRRLETDEIVTVYRKVFDTK